MAQRFSVEREREREREIRFSFTRGREGETTGTEWERREGEIAKGG